MEIRNNCASPNFGMAFSITKKGAEKVAQMSEKQLERLGEAAKEMADTKFVDMIVNEYGVTLKKSKSIGCQYTDFILNKPYTCGGLTAEAKNVAGCADHGSSRVIELTEYSKNGAAQEIYERINSLPYEEKVLEIAKLLEAHEAKIAAENAAKAQAEARRVDLATSLINKYQMDV